LPNFQLDRFWLHDPNSSQASGGSDRRCKLVLRQPSTHARLNHGMLERDASDLGHDRCMMRHRLANERGFTLIEVLVVIIIIAILASIALAVFLNQEDKGRDSSAKSNVTNLVHLVEACNAGLAAGEDFRDCDTETDLEPSIPIDPAAPQQPSTSDCDDADPGTVLVGMARVAFAGKNCFVVVGASRSNNKFWYVKHNDGTVFRNCSTAGVGGCPSDGLWAG
jgi:type IV pilus assembly protein PilA